MLSLVTFDECLTPLRLDDEQAEALEDYFEQILIPAVSGSVRRWLKDEWRLYVPAVDSHGVALLDSDGNPIPMQDDNGPVVDPIVKRAVLMELNGQIEDEKSGGERVPAHEGHGYILSDGATRILSGLRKPTVA